MKNKLFPKKFTLRKNVNIAVVAFFIITFTIGCSSVDTSEPKEFTTEVVTEDTRDVSDWTQMYNNKEESQEECEINELKEDDVYIQCSDFINDNSEDILDYVSKNVNSAVTFNLLAPSDNPHYNNYMEVMEDVAKLLGAKEKDGTYLYMHSRNSVGGSSAYFSWRFLVNNNEYLVYVQDDDTKDYWTVGIDNYEKSEY